jgi:hypothetical protein
VKLLIPDDFASGQGVRPIQGPCARRQPRSSLFLAAVLSSGSEQAPVRVRNMSPNGAMVETPVGPPPGTQVHLKRGVLAARGTVSWRSANRCGLHFDSEVSVRDWLAVPAKGEQQRVDDIVAMVKAGGPGPTVEKLIAEAPRTHEQLTEDLSEVVKLMQDLEDDLSSSDATRERHGMKLQHLDIAMQMLRALAAELGPRGRDVASGSAKLRDLRVACSQALIARQGLPLAGFPVMPANP